MRFDIIPRASALLIAIGALGACTVEGGAPADAEKTGAVEQHAYWKDNVRWTWPVIPVCWRTAGYETEKEWVRLAVESAYEGKSQFYVDFTHWRSCDELPGGAGSWLEDGAKGIHIEIDDVRSSVEDLGNELSGDPDGMTLNLIHKVWNPCPDLRYCIENTAVHEFGHALGMAHEQNRDDTPATCTDEKQGSEGDMVGGAWDPDSVMNYCNKKDRRKLSAGDIEGLTRMYGGWGTDVHFGDFDKDGLADRLYFRRVAFFGTTQWTELIVIYGKGGGWAHQTGPAPFCGAPTGELEIGDFNGDGRDDVLCHDTSSGQNSIRYANSAGQLADAEWRGTVPWCYGGAQLLVGKINGDNRADLLCHDKLGYKWVAYADVAGRFGYTSWESRMGWCGGDAGDLRLADFNGDGRADLLCHERNTGHKWIAYATPEGRYTGTGWDGATGWCAGGELIVADMDGDKRADLLCHSPYDGQKWISFANHLGQFVATQWHSAMNWCYHPGSKVSVANIDSSKYQAEIFCDDTQRHHWQVRNFSPLRLIHFYPL